MLIPLYGFLEGDSIGLLVLAQDQDLIRKVASNLMQAASMRVQPFEKPKVYFSGRLLDPDVTLAQAGLEPLDRIDVRRDVQGCTRETSWLSKP